MEEGREEGIEEAKQRRKHREFKMAGIELVMHLVAYKFPHHCSHLKFSVFPSSFESL